MNRTVEPWEGRFERFSRKLEGVGAHPLQREIFRRHLRALLEGGRGALPEAELEPVEGLPSWEELGVDGRGGEGLEGRVASLVLNGGLGTTMGLQGPKSLLPVREGLTPLDLLARRILRLRGGASDRWPLLLLNSFHTSRATLAHLERYPGLSEQPLPLELLQSQVPKVLASDLSPVEWPQAPHLEWCPPGHGDVYPSLYLSRRLEALLGLGVRFLFLSNVDNLGATLDLRIPAWMEREQVPFVMEVADRTPADRKGGHLAREGRTGRLILRELAQCPPEELDRFQDVERHRYFNTNNLWVDLQALHDRLESEGGCLPLPLIVNTKPVDPRAPGSPQVHQLETAMGAALSILPGARAVRVPRARFAPVKTTADLLRVRSDAYVLGEGDRLVLRPELAVAPEICLDARYYRTVPELDARFPEGPPSLRGCARLVVEGDVVFEGGVVLRGEVRLRAEGRARVPAGAVLEGDRAC